MNAYDYSNDYILKEKLKKYLLHIRKDKEASTNKQNESKKLRQVIGCEVREGYYNGEFVKRLVIFMRGTGCTHVKETGGCTFCGFYSATNFGEKIPDQYYTLQIKSVIESDSFAFSEYPIICLYNDGSMLNEDEISFGALAGIFDLLERHDSVKKIVIESRIKDITEEKLIKLKQASKKELEIAVGFESANETIRDLCVNKNFTEECFREIHKLSNDIGISIVPLLMIKPPFLTELEAINDYIESLTYLEQFHFQRIDIELPTVEKGTLVYKLWQKQMYVPLWFWSVVKILNLAKTAGLKTPLYISPQNYSVMAEAKTSNCENCDQQVYDAINLFNQKGDVAIFDSIQCKCKLIWENQLKNEVWEGEISYRIWKSLEVLFEDAENKEELE